MQSTIVRDYFADDHSIRTELSLGVIAPNLALSPAIYRQFFKREKPYEAQNYFQKERSRHGSRIRSVCSQHCSTDVQSSRSDRGASVARSDDSELPLRALIENRTEIPKHRECY